MISYFWFDVERIKNIRATTIKKCDTEFRVTLLDSRGSDLL